MDEENILKDQESEKTETPIKSEVEESSTEESIKEENQNLADSTQKVDENDVKDSKKEPLISKLKKKLTKKAIAIIIVALVIIAIISTIAISVSKNNKLENDAELLYDTMEDSVSKLNSVADEIYSCWYDYIYKDKYSSVDIAIFTAQINESTNISLIKANDAVIANTLDELKDRNYKNKNEEAYEAMLDAYDSYKEYYEFVINVSGSFNSYSAKKEDLKKEVKSYLNKLERNL